MTQTSLFFSISFRPNVLIDFEVRILTFGSQIYMRRQISTLTKGQLISKANCQAMNSSIKWTNEFIYTIYYLCNVFSFVFWKKLKIPKRHFEIIWPLRMSWRTCRLKNESPKNPALVSIFMRGRGLERVRRQRSACENYSTPYHGVK